MNVYSPREEYFPSIGHVDVKPLEGNPHWRSVKFDRVIRKVG
jgi:hypothetical protein